MKLFSGMILCPEKGTSRHVCPSKTQISLHIYAVCSDCDWCSMGSQVENSDKTDLNFCCISALDKLLGQLGIYATWLSSIAYLQKQLRILIFFLRHIFFFCDYTFSYCMNPSGMCLHIYSLPLSAFLKYQTRGFYCT